MKRSFAFLLFLCLGWSGFSQTAQEEIPSASRDKNELSVNAFNLIAFGALDLVYERLLNENSSLSSELFVNFSEDDYSGDPYFKDFSLTGKYKHFFSAGYARGFYVHGFGMFSSGEYESGSYYDPQTGFYHREEESYSDFAIGFGLGGKFVSRGGFLLDVSSGIGRNLFNSESPELVGQFMINLGLRF